MNAVGTKKTGFQSSLECEQVWPPKLVNVRGFKKVEFPVAIQTYETSKEEAKEPAPVKETKDAGLPSTNSNPLQQEN